MVFTAGRAMRVAVTVLCLGFAIPMAQAGATQDVSASDTQSFWQPLPADTAKVAPASRRFELDTTAFGRALQKRDGVRVVSLPLAKGGFSDFTLRDSGTLPAALAARFPELRSLRGEDRLGRRVRIDVSPAGVDAMIFADDGVQVIRPVGQGGVHESLARDDDAGRIADRCEADDAPPSAIDRALSSLQSAERSAGPAASKAGAAVHHTYRLALAATGEYTKAVCAPAAASASCGLSAMATTINRVNEIYENDLAVTLTLVENNDLLVFTDGATDPYSNGDTAKLLVENQNTLTDLIGNAAYDVGHVFGTGNAGRAAINVTCKTGSKGRGATGRANPRGDAFDVDFVAHEIGHQFGANHTFNGNTGSCAGDNRVPAAAYEPGSGSTIMAYAGICGSQNLQANSDPYFHAHSLHELQAEIAADSCDVETPVQNQAPVVAAPAAHYTIPARTPFVLRASGSDADGDAITYAWEQFDLGPVQTGTNPDAAAVGPLLRSYAPTPDPERSIPRLATLLGAAPAKGEVLPTGYRALRFRVTARDNHATSGRTQSADTTVDVVDSGAAFAILAPNTGDDTLTCGADFNLAWNPAGTAQAPVSCPTVDVLLSSDGGVNFDRILASAIPNRGQATLHVPLPTGDSTRLQLRCSNNIFFDINDADLRVLDVGAANAVADVLPASLEDTPRNIASSALTGNDSGGGPVRVVGVSNAVGGQVSLVDGVVRFVPSPNATGTAGFDYSLLDRCERGATQPASARVRFPLTQVNDAPVLKPMTGFIFVAQKGGSGSIAGFAKVDHFGAPDEAGQQVLAYLVDVVDGGNVISEASILPDGTLHAVSGGGVGTATIRVRMRDNGGTANGGVDLSAERTFTMTATHDANLVLGIEQARTTVAVGETIEYRVTLENAGVEGIGWADLQQSLPAGIDWASWTCSADGGTCPADTGNGAIDVQLPMPPHSRFSFVVSGVVGADAGAVLKADVAARIANDDGSIVTEKKDTALTQVVRLAVFSDGMEG